MSPLMVHDLWARDRRYQERSYWARLFWLRKIIHRYNGRRSVKGVRAGNMPCLPHLPLQPGNSTFFTNGWSSKYTADPVTWPPNAVWVWLSGRKADFELIIAIMNRNPWVKGNSFLHKLWKVAQASDLKVCPYQFCWVLSGPRILSDSCRAYAATPGCTVGHPLLANLCGCQICARSWRRLRANYRWSIVRSDLHPSATSLLWMGEWFSCCCFILYI